MKKLILTATLLLSCYAFDARTKIVRSGSSDGIHYDYVREEHSLFNHTLTCSRPGAITCGWTSHHRVKGSNGDIEVAIIEEWIEQQIALGNMNGSQIYENTGIKVVWTAYGSDRDITIYDYSKS
jgi:hypothetical protein